MDTKTIITELATLKGELEALRLLRTAELATAFVLGLALGALVMVFINWGLKL